MRPFAVDEDVRRAFGSGTARALAHRAVRVAEDPALWADLRRRAAEIKARVLGDLDGHLVRLEERVVARGGRVHWAPDAAAARRVVIDVAARHGVGRVLRSKTMVGEEIELNAALEAAGIEPVETDLGEFIVQLDRDRPIHIVAPAMDRSRQSIGRLFERELGAPYSEDATELTEVARRHLRPIFREAAMGVSGANFAVAETGTIVVVENEANARLTMRRPPVHVVLMGIEKVVPTLDDLAVLLHLLPRSATGQKMTSYVNHVTGSDRELHLVLIDNGRTRVLADPGRRELLACIRCGACLNVCPVYQTVGGKPYDWVYPGPIGLALGPLQRGPGRSAIAGASSLCGACTEICPVGIDLAGHIVEGRAEPGRPRTWRRRAAFRLYRIVMGSSLLYRLASRGARVGHRLLGDRIFPAAWRRHRAVPIPAARTFHELWREGIE